MAASAVSISEGPYTELTFSDRNVYATLDNTPPPNSSGVKSTGQSSPFHRQAAVALGILCVILLTSTITLSVLFLDTRQRVLQEPNSLNYSCREENDRLKEEYNRLSHENDLLKKDSKRLFNGKDQLHKDYSIISNQKDQLQKDYNILSNQKDQLQEDYNKLLNEKDRLEKEKVSPEALLTRLYEPYGISPSCPEGWRLFSVMCYFFSTERRTWDNSRKYCRNRGADLVVVNSQDEQKFINQNAIGGHYWIGLQDTADRTFVWVDGTDLQQTFWKAGSPDRNRGTLRHAVLTGPGEELWVDTQRTHTWMWICETIPSK